MAKCADGDPAFSQWIDTASTLTPYATHYRYPCAEADPGLDETREAIHLATALYAFVNAKFLATPQED